MLHRVCQQAAPSPGPGSCLMCQSSTSSASYRLCDTCSEDLGQCKVCLGDIYDEPKALRPRQPGVFFVKKNEKDNGSTIKLKVGEELHITLPEEDHSWKEWVVKDYTFGILALCDEGQFALDPGEMQYGSRTIIMVAEKSGTSPLEIQEEHEFGGTTGAAPWKCTVVVK